MPILKALSFEIEQGHLTGIIGPNGSGKSTLLRTLSGILHYTGSLSFEKKSIQDWDKKQLAQRLAVLAQNPTISFEFEVWDYVMLGRTPHKGWLEGESSADREKVEEVLSQLDLKDFAHRHIPSLSGGERQRVLLAQALVQDTPLLLLDEPTSHLDIYHQFDLLKRIRRLVDEGKTALVVFHDLSLAARFTDRLMVLKNGQLVKHGATREVLSASLIEDVFNMKVTLTSGTPPTIQFLDQA